MGLREAVMQAGVLTVIWYQWGVGVVDEAGVSPRKGVVVVESEEALNNDPVSNCNINSQHHTSLDFSGLAPLLLFSKLSSAIECVRTLAVVVPFPDSSFVLLATSWTSLALNFLYLPFKSINFATKTPIFCYVGTFPTLFNNHYSFHWPHWWARLAQEAAQQWELSRVRVSKQAVGITKAAVDNWLGQCQVSSEYGQKWCHEWTMTGPTGRAEVPPGPTSSHCQSDQSSCHGLEAQQR